MIKEESVYKIGKLGKPHGIKGEISMQFSDDVFDRTDAEYLILELDGIMVPFFMEEYRFKSDETALVKFEGIDTQERARDLTNVDVYFPRDNEGGEDDDELTYAQLVGYTVLKIDAEGNPVSLWKDRDGVIAFIDEQTDNIMFELTDGTLLPASEELIAGVDTATRTVVMDLPEGLLEL